jgi:phospholipid transport system transporter-binding protein
MASNETVRLVVGKDGGHRLEGALTFASVPKLAAAHPRHPAAEIDLGGVTRADSAGLALLLEWQRTAGEDGDELVYRDLPEQLAAIARVSNLAELLPAN